MNADGYGRLTFGMLKLLDAPHVQSHISPDIHIDLDMDIEDCTLLGIKATLIELYGGVRFGIITRNMPAKLVCILDYGTNMVYVCISMRGYIEDIWAAMTLKQSGILEHTLRIWDGLAHICDHVTSSDTDTIRDIIRGMHSCIGKLIMPRYFCTFAVHDPNGGVTTCRCRKEVEKAIEIALIECGYHHQKDMCRVEINIDGEMLGYMVVDSIALFRTKWNRRANTMDFMGYCMDRYQLMMPGLHPTTEAYMKMKHHKHRYYRW